MTHKTLQEYLNDPARKASAKLRFARQAAIIETKVGKCEESEALKQAARS